MRIKVRSYRNGDEKEIIALFNKEFTKNALTFCCRDEKRWTTQFIEHPEVSLETTFIAEAGKKVIGYLIGRISRQDGLQVFEILDLVTTSLSSGIVLLHSVDAFSAEHDIDLAVSYSHPDLADLNFLMRHSGYIALELPVLMTRLSNPKAFFIPFLEYVNKYKAQSVVRLVPKKVLLCIGKIRISFNIGSSGIILAKAGIEAHLKIQMNMKTFVKVVFCKQSIIKSIFYGDISVKPFRRLSWAIRFLKTFQIELPWYIPIGDMF